MVILFNQEDLGLLNTLLEATREKALAWYAQDKSKEIVPQDPQGLDVVFSEIVDLCELLLNDFTELGGLEGSQYQLLVFIVKGALESLPIMEDIPEELKETLREGYTRLLTNIESLMRRSNFIGFN